MFKASWYKNLTFLALALFLIAACGPKTGDGRTNNGSGSGNGNGNGSGGGASTPPGGSVRIPSEFDLVPVAKISLNNVSGWCTGTLVADQIVLTAAHCFDEVTIGKPVTPAGVSLREKDGKWSAPYGVDGFFALDYRRLDIFKDIAWIKLKTAPTKVSAPIKVATNARILPNNSPVSHFGVTSNKWFHLKKVPFLNPDPTMGYKPVQIAEAQDWMVSAGYDAATSTSSAGGNSGGPLLFKQDGEWLLLGVLQGDSAIFADRQGSIAAAGFTAIEPFIPQIKADTGVDVKTVAIK